MAINPAVSQLFIVQPLTGFSLENIFSTRPTTEARVERLRRLARNVFRSPAYAGDHW